MSIKIWEAYRVRRGVDPFDLLWDLKRTGQEAARIRLKKIFDDVLDGRSHTEHLKFQQQDGLFKRWLREKHPEAADEKVPASRIVGWYQTWTREACPEELRIDKTVLAVGDEEVLECAGRDKGDGVRPGAFDVDQWMHRRYGEQLGSMRRSEWDLDVCVTMRRYRGRFYLVPYCDRVSILRGTLDYLGDDGRLEDFHYQNSTDPPEDVPSREWTWRGTVWWDLTQHDRWNEFVTIDIVAWDGWHLVSPMVDVLRERGGQGL